MPGGHPHILPELRAQDSRSAPWLHQLLPQWSHSRASLQLPQPWAQPSSAHPWAQDPSPTPGDAHIQGWGCAGVPSCPALGWGWDRPWLPAAPLPFMKTPCHYRHLGHCGSSHVRGQFISTRLLSIHFRVREWTGRVLSTVAEDCKGDAWTAASSLPSRCVTHAASFSHIFLSLHQ